MSRLTVTSVLMVLFLPGCGGNRNQRYSEVVAWAEENGMAIGVWQAGQIPDDNFDERLWIEKGRRIPEVEQKLQELLRNCNQLIEPVLVIRALGCVGTESSVPLLIEQLEDEWDVMRGEAIVSLGEIGGSEATQILARELCFGRSEGDRRNAAWALVILGSSDGLEPLENAINNLQEEQDFMKLALDKLRHKLDHGVHEPLATPGSPSIGGQPGR